MVDFSSRFQAASWRPVNVCLIGDSTVEGAGFTRFDDTWYRRLQAYLRTTYGDHGTGFIGAHNMGGWGTINDGELANDLGPNQAIGTPFGTLYRLAPSATVTISTKFYGDTFRPYFASAMDTISPASVSIDGETVVAIGGRPTTSFQPQVASIPTTAGWHTAVITAPASGAFYYAGFEWTTGSTGISVHNFGRGGALSAAFGLNADRQMAFVSLVGCHIAVLSLGVNDAIFDISAASYRANMQNVIDYLQTLPPNPAILILDQADTVGDFGLRQRPLRLIERHLAVDNRVGYASIASRWGDYANACYLGFMNADGIHPNDLGQSDITEMLIDRLTEAPGVRGRTR
jgi:lysophospholipase L1-like esterase